MPSTIVHLALGGLVAAALLGDRLTPRALAVVLAIVALPDLDTFLGLWIQGGHRAVLHTALLPAVLGVVLYWDLRARAVSLLRLRWGDHGARVAVVAVVALAAGGIAPDLFTNGVNVFYPFHDQFYALDGTLRYSTERGFVQTFVELAPESDSSGSSTAVGSTDEVHYRTGVDPSAGGEPEQVERTFHLLGSGTELLLVLVSALIAGVRLREDPTA